MIAPLPVKPADPPSFMTTWTGRTVAQGHLFHWPSPRTPFSVKVTIEDSHMM
jgi:hypothetical protein